MMDSDIILRTKYKLYVTLGAQTRDLFLRLRGFLHGLRYITRFSIHKVAKKNIFYFVIDPNFKHHPGLADRIKGLLSCYYIANRNGYQFKIVDSIPQGISKYMSPANYNWISDFSELEYSLTETRFFIYTPLRYGLNSKLKKDKQYHCYCYQGDDIFYKNGSEYIKPFRDLFVQLFRPSDLVQKAINASGLEYRRYIAVHARFINALEPFESSRYPTLPEDRKKDLIKRCIVALKLICQREKLPVVMFSDSKIFLEQARTLPVIVLETKNISHISFADDTVLQIKTYLDFFLISRAATLYRLNAKELHATNFSLYAAFAGDVKTVDVHLPDNYCTDSHRYKFVEYIDIYAH